MQTNSAILSEEQKKQKHKTMPRYVGESADHSLRSFRREELA